MAARRAAEGEAAGPLAELDVPPQPAVSASSSRQQAALWFTTMPPAGTTPFRATLAVTPSIRDSTIGPADPTLRSSGAGTALWTGSAGSGGCGMPLQRQAPRSTGAAGARGGDRTSHGSGLDCALGPCSRGDESGRRRSQLGGCPLHLSGRTQQTASRSGQEDLQQPGRAGQSWRCKTEPRTSATSGEIKLLYGVPGGNYSRGRRGRCVQQHPRSDWIRSLQLGRQQCGALPHESSWTAQGAGLPPLARW